MTSKTMDVLRKTPLFATLPDDDLRRVADLAVSRRFAKKEAVFREGDRADGFFIVASGKVKVFKLSGEGKEQVLHVLEAGQTFAEAVIFQGGGYPAHAETLADTELYFLPKGAFLDLLERHPKIAIRMLASLSLWLKRMTDLVESLSLKDVETRLVFYLSEELKTLGIPPKDGAELELPIGKNVLASRLGTVPETFSRTLKKLQDDGLISVRGKRIRIVSAERLFSILLR
ncbi:Crp/Fnr family transcriptional regulator [Candidatus Deferrimicrobium sp.]|uniref:Crp/Fnr family transcriptional regulator n=1 Tax=Candidatus Deferrimicrobium sp. TaxID=3060586 RepID=UPI0027205A2D|nr:Crp/Fnr family transcriptional regulator [Candidatus Deferrimicrobium sp.]MDO8739379.1 Crp/Fnr family transcriptional regulator [Candidatus Deferrimicrobium sp.]